MRRFMRGIGWSSCSCLLAIACSDDGVSASGETGSSGDATSATTASTGTLDGTDTMTTTSASTAAPTTTDATTGPGDTESGTTVADSSGGGSTGGGSSGGSGSDSGSSDTGSSSGGMGSSSSGEAVLPDISGSHLLVISTTLAPDLPLQYDVTVVQTANGGGALLDISMQPLTLDVGSTTTPRLPLGAPLVFDDVAVAADGSFSIDVGQLDIDGLTNPVTGSDATAQNVVLDGQLVSDDSWCGTVTGDLTVPLMFDLGGTTFAGTGYVGALPAVSDLGC
ncbi:MAG: hypothetical protein IPH07_19180 [Deltaproteobacteria bacterium]|nr:hypothetical protein [Deltaproteobacteria bacterium]MBP7286557.1 hypothetical protein [Nannocystaceae bacterium]